MEEAKNSLSAAQRQDLNEMKRVQTLLSDPISFQPFLWKTLCRMDEIAGFLKGRVLRTDSGQEALRTRRAAT